MNMRKALAVRRNYRTNSDFDLLFKENWISDIEDLKLLVTLVNRCVEERGLLEAKSLLSENEKVMNRISKEDPELAYRVWSGDWVSAFDVLGQDELGGIVMHLSRLKDVCLELGIRGTCSIEDDDGIVVFKYKERGLWQVHMLGEGFNVDFNNVLEDTVRGILISVSEPVKRLFFSIEGTVKGGYMVSSHIEEGSFDIYLK